MPILFENFTGIVLRMIRSYAFMDLWSEIDRMHCEYDFFIVNTHNTLLHLFWYLDTIKERNLIGDDLWTFKTNLFGVWHSGKVGLIL